MTSSASRASWILAYGVDMLSIPDGLGSSILTPSISLVLLVVTDGCRRWRVIYIGIAHWIYGYAMGRFATITTNNIYTTGMKYPITQHETAQKSVRILRNAKTSPVHRGHAESNTRPPKASTQSTNVHCLVCTSVPHTHACTEYVLSCMMYADVPLEIDLRHAADENFPLARREGERHKNKIARGLRDFIPGAAVNISCLMDESATSCAS